MFNRCRTRLAAAVILGIASSSQAQTASKLIDKETFFQMESISNPVIAPDGSQIVFTRGFVDAKKDQNASSLWIVDGRGERLRQLTEGTYRDSSAAFSPDGKRIAFLSNRSGSTQIHVMWLDTREMAQLTRLDSEPSAPLWSPDGSKIAFTVRVLDETSPLPIKLPKTPKGAELAKSAVLVDRTVWGADGTGPTTKGFTHVFLVDANTGGTSRQVTSGDYNHNAPSFSPDGKTLYVSGIRKPDAEYLKGDSEIYAISLDTLEAKALTDRKGEDSSPEASPDGKWIAYLGHDEKGYTNDVDSLHLMSNTGENKRILATGLPSSPGDLTWGSDGVLYYSMEEKGEKNIYSIATRTPGASPQKFTTGTHVLNGLAMARSGMNAAIRTSAKEPGVLVSFTLLRPNDLRVLVDVNKDVLEGVKLADSEELWVTSPDGLKVQGWLMKPANFDPSKKYPMVLWIHGGPWSMYSVAWNWAFQNFAANGYAVLWMNPRGSTGYGQDFVNGIQNAYPGKDYDDLMATVDAALAKGFVDKDNLFVCGGSGGGVLTAWIVGHTNRFRAAGSMRPVINWHSFVGNTDSASWYDQFKKYPWEDPMEYARTSPLTYVGNVTTPTLVMTGEADLRTPIPQSEEFYRALKMLRKADTLLVRMPEEFHGWRRPTHQIAQQLYLQAWFEKYRTKASKDAVPAQP
ncbi:MAG TPA: S9 family peptidase [Vicinamibacteria bacterium]|nr:S9 family peptidase [Vicinamibacteria bacterium]